MPDSHSVVLFTGAALAILLIPGPAVLYIVSQSAEHGRLAGLVSVAGVHLGTLVLGLTFVVLGFLTDGLYALTAGTLARRLEQRRPFLRYASGSVFVGLGVSAALAKRA